MAEQTWSTAQFRPVPSEEFGPTHSRSGGRRRGEGAEKSLREQDVLNVLRQNRSRRPGEESMIVGGSSGRSARGNE